MKQKHSKEAKIKINHANESIQKIGLVDPTKYIYESIFDEDDSHDTNIIQYFIIHGLGLCIKLNNVSSHMFY